MVLEVRNTSTAWEIEKLAKYFKYLNLATYLGQKISNFATGTICHIKIMQGITIIEMFMAVTIVTALTLRFPCLTLNIILIALTS